MTADATVVRFPARRSPVVWIIPDGPAWTVLAGNHGWSHGSRDEADEDAAWMARNLGMAIRVVAP